MERRKAHDAKELRDLSRQMYLTKREQQKLDELRDKIEDEERLFAVCPSHQYNLESRPSEPGSDTALRVGWTRGVLSHSWACRLISCMPLEDAPAQCAQQCTTVIAECWGPAAARVAEEGGLFFSHTWTNTSLPPPC